MKPIIKLQSSIGNSAVDQRGKIFSFLPQQDIKEFVYIETIKGYDRGHHYHPEFDEYIVLTKGKGKFVEKTNAETRDIFVEAGECVLIPKGVFHTFVPETNCSSVSCLTKAWDDCENPILR